MEDISSSDRSQIYNAVFLPCLQVSRTDRKDEPFLRCLQPRSGDASQHEIIFMTSVTELSKKSGTFQQLKHLK
jgi:hypothetical protein